MASYSRLLTRKCVQCGLCRLSWARNVIAAACWFMKNNLYKQIVPSLLASIISSQCLMHFPDVTKLRGTYELHTSHCIIVQLQVSYGPFSFFGALLGHRRYLHSLNWPHIHNFCSSCWKEQVRNSVVYFTYEETMFWYFVIDFDSLTNTETSIIILNDLDLIDAYFVSS